MPSLPSGNLLILKGGARCNVVVLPPKDTVVTSTLFNYCFFGQPDLLVQRKELHCRLVITHWARLKEPLSVEDGGGIGFGR